MEDVVARVAGTKLTWQVDRSYPHLWTAFIWVEDARPIASLNYDLLDEGRPGEIRIDNPAPTKLYMIKPTAMHLLPDWCNWTQTLEEQHMERFLFGELISSRSPSLRPINSPLVLHRYGEEWRLFSVKRADASDWRLNLREYGLEDAERMMDMVTPAL